MKSLSDIVINADLTVDTNTLYVDSTNNRVGIGTTSPQDLLHLSASSPVLRLTNTSDTGKSSIEFWDNQGGTSQSGEVFYDDSSNLFGLQANANGIVFRASNTFPGSELMRLTSAGRLGIGTTSPSTKLQVSGVIRAENNGQALDLVGTDHAYQAWYPRGTSSGRKAYMGFASGSTTSFTIMNEDTGDFKIGTNSTERIRIASAGNVGIGTTAPASKLHVTGAGSGTFRAESTSSDYPIRISGYQTTADAYIGVDSSNKLKLYVNSNDRLVINSSGNVGIGTAGPAYKLDVDGDIQINETLIAKSGADLILQARSSQVVGINSNGARTMTLDASNNVGIGTTSPGEKLDVAGNIQASGSRFIRAEYDSNHYMQLESNSSGGILKGLDGGTTTVLVRSYGDSYFNGGDFGIGTSSPSNKLHVVGDFFLKGSNTSSSTKNFQVQTGNGTSIMDFRNDAYAFFGCGQGGGSASGFIFRYNSTFGVQFTGYNYGNGSSPSYKPILMDTDLAGRSQGVYINYGITGYTAPAPTTTAEFAVRGRGTSSNYTAKFEDSSTNPLLYIKDNGNVTVGTATDSGYKFDVEGNTNTNGDYYVNGNQGWSGTINIPTNPPISITVEGGIITNVT